MKYKSTFLIAIFTLFLWYGFSLQAQDFGSRGTDFWVTFGSNLNKGTTSLELQLRIVGGEQDAKGTFYFTELGLPVPFSVAAGKVHTFPLSSSQKVAVYNNTSGISNYSVHITTDNPVMAYAFNRSNFSTDATNLIPTVGLGTDYYQISYVPQPGAGTTPPSPDAYAVIATKDATQIYHNNTSVATLNAGQVYYHTSAIGTDMTGAHITADKPVAFFAVNQGVYIPTGTQAADHLFQQLAPVNTWGKKFFVPVSHFKADRVRIIASQDSTRITRNGGNMITNTGGQMTGNNLRAGQFIEIEVQLTQNGCYIEANKPVAVCTYLKGSESHSEFGGISDPSQAWVAPIEQNVKSALLAPFVALNVPAYTHYALVVTPTATRFDTRVKTGNGTPQPVTTGTWYSNDCGMSFCTMTLTDPSASYNFTNPAGLVILGYGAIDRESYYYLLSSAMRTLDACFYVNDIHYQELFEPVCAQPVRFRAEIDEGANSSVTELKWYIDDVEEVTARNQMRWEKTLTVNGEYKIKMEVRMSDGTTKIREGVFKIAIPVLNSLENLRFCIGEDVSPISFTGDYIDTCIWQVTSGSGVAIGMNAENGIGTIPGFKTMNTTNAPLSVTVTVTPKNKNNCTGDPETFTITVLDPKMLKVDLGNDTTVCYPDSLILNAENEYAISYQWQDGSNKATYTIYSTGGEYWVVVKGPCNTRISDTINVTYLDNLKVDIGNDTSFCKGDEIHIELDVTNPHASYLWQDGDTSSHYVIEKEGVYRVEVSNACISETKEITIEEIDCELDVTIPNIFTPNGDKLNELFAPQFTPLENLGEFQMHIYNRWGRLVFSTESYEKLWDGKSTNGQPNPEGVYYYQLYFTHKIFKNKEYRCHGAITLIR